MDHDTESPLSLPQEPSQHRVLLSPRSLNIDESILSNNSHNFRSLSPTSYSARKHHHHHHSLFNHNKRHHMNHIDLKSKMAPINTAIITPIGASVDGSIASTDSYFRSMTKPLDAVRGFIMNRFSSTANFRPIRPIFSFDSNSFAELPEEQSIRSDDDSRTICFDDEDDDNMTENTDNTFAGLHPLQFPAFDSYSKYNRKPIDFENWSVNTPTTDYTQFRLYGAIAMSPFNVNKKSFFSLHNKATLKSADQTTLFSVPIIPKMTLYQTIFTLVNLYVNNTILFNSYALKRGGLFAVFIFGLLCIWLCYTAKLMVYALSSNAGLSLYQNMGCCFSVLISFVIVLENIGRTIIGLITMWQNILYVVRFDVLSDEDPLETQASEFQLQVNIAMISSAVLLLPTVWMLFFSDLVFDSILGFISTWSLALIVIINYVINNKIDEEVTNTEIMFWPQDVSGLVLCIGIFIANMAGHSCLPTIYNQMQDKSEYNYALNVSWVIIFIIEMTTGLFGYCTYGSNTKVMITESMLATSVPNEPRHVLFTILTVCIVINLFVHVPIGVAIASGLPENVLQLKHSLIRRVFRTVFFIVIVYSAWLCLEQVALLSAFIGSILTLSISMLCPLLAKIYIMNLTTKKNKNIVIVIVLVVFTSFSIFMLYILFDFHAHSGDDSA